MGLLDASGAPVAPPPTDPIIEMLEQLLAAARERRLLFIVASAGVIEPPKRDTFLLDTLGVPSTRTSDQQAPRAFKVTAGGLTGPNAEHLAAAALRDACSDVIVGVRAAEANLASAIADLADARTKLEGGRS